MQIVGPTLDRRSDCEAILHTLPRWFGIEPTLQMYVQDTCKFSTFALESEAELAAFITLRQHFPQAWEIHCMAVRADARGKGAGTMLLNHAEAWLVQQGARHLQVKTVAATSSSTAYALTREFYQSRGFLPLEVFPELWDSHSPALQCIKMLNAA